MKRLFCIVLACVTLLSLAACSLEANPGATTAPTGSTQTATEATAPTQAPTEPAADVAPWAENELRALIPEPPGRVSKYDWSGLTVNITGTSIEEMEAYCDQLLSAGFDAYHDMSTFESAVGRQFIFYGRSLEGIYIQVNTMTVQTSKALIEIHDYRAVEDTEESEPWGADEYQQLLPDPGCSYRNAQVAEYLYEGKQTRHYAVMLSRAMGYEKAKEYAQSLRDAGFLYREKVSDSPFYDQYSFRASNAEGYMVYFSVGARITPTVILFEPGMDGPGRDWEDEPVRAFLPEPDCENFVQNNTSYITTPAEGFRLEGMDYEDAKAYAQALQEKGYITILTEKDDPAAQTYVFEAFGTIQKTGDETIEDNRLVKLVFDPSQTLENGTPYCTLSFK